MTIVPPPDVRYSESHEWARLDEDGKTVAVGITDFAVKELQDLVFITLPKPGTKVARGQRFGEIESVKAVSDLIAPVDGEVLAVNGALEGKLEVLAQDPYGAGWMIQVRTAGGPEVLAGLMDAEAYARFTREAGHH